MKKALKIGCFSMLGFVGAFFILFIILELAGVSTDLPEEEQPSSSVEKVDQPEPEAQKVEAKKQNPPQPKRIDWNKTPAEQGLKVGDWIIAQGHANAYIGAIAVRKGDKNYKLSDHNLSDIDTKTGKYFLKTARGGTELQVWELDHSNTSYFQLESSNKYPVTPKLKIDLVTVVGISNSSELPIIRQYNLLQMQEQRDITELIVSGQITKISEPQKYEDAILHYIDIEFKEGSILKLSATETEIAQGMMEARANASSVMQKFLQGSE